MLLQVQEIQVEIWSFNLGIGAILEAEVNQDLPHQINLMAVSIDNSFLHLEMQETGGEIIIPDKDQCHKEMEIAISTVSMATLKENATLTSHTYANFRRLWPWSW